VLIGAGVTVTDGDGRSSKIDELQRSRLAPFVHSVSFRSAAAQMCSSTLYSNLQQHICTANVRDVTSSQSPSVISPQEL